jgi:glucokinase
MTRNIGIDLGGTKVRLALVDNEGRVLSEDLFPTGDARQVQSMLKGVAERVSVCLQKADLSTTDIGGIGVGCAGQISGDGRKVLFSPNLYWEQVPLADVLEDLLNTRVAVENDVRAAALGEAAFGAGQGCRDLVCIFAGTGVGSGIIIGGRLLRGSRNLAGEVGHTKLDPEGPLCTCGGHGCLEVYAGGSHVRRRVLEALEQDRSSKLSQAKDIHVKAVEDAARRGDPLGKQFWNEVVWSLRLGISNLVTLLNPERIILGGGVVEASPILVEKVREAVDQWVTLDSKEHVEVVRAQLGPRAGAIGASQLFPDSD